MRSMSRTLRAFTRLVWGGLPLLLLLSCSESEPERFPRPDFSAPELPGGELVVAEIDGEQITAAQVWHKLKIQFPKWEQEGPGMAQQAPQILQQLITERCFANYGDDVGLSQDPSLLQGWFFSREFILCNLTVDRQVYARTKPTDEEIRAFWEENKERYVIPPRVWWHHILVATEAEAWDFRQRVISGEDFESLAQQFSLDTLSVARGGKMPPMTDRYECGPLLGTLPEFGKAIMGMQEKELSKPMRTKHGWHIVQADYRRNQRPRELEEMREQIIEKLASRRQLHLYNDVLDSLKIAYKVHTHDDALEEFYYLQMDDEMLFDGAQRSSEPEKKVGHYEQILKRFPESPHQPEALFMIGFVCAEELGDSLRASESFRAFLDQYPDHEMARSARLMIDELN